MSTKFKRGDNCRVVADNSHHCFKKGTEIFIFYVNEYHEIQGVDEYGSTRSFSDSDLELIEEKTFPRMMMVGDDLEDLEPMEVFFIAPFDDILYPVVAKNSDGKGGIYTFAQEITSQEEKPSLGDLLQNLEKIKDEMIAAINNIKSTCYDVPRGAKIEHK